MKEKILGYVLLTVGITIIIASAWPGYKILSQKSQPPKFTSFSNISMEIVPSLGIPTESVDYILNLSIYLILLGFLAKAGWHIASLGIMLVKK